MISFFLFVYLLTFVTCKSFHANQHLPVQKFQAPLSYQPYQQYIPIYRPPLKAGDPNTPPLNGAALSDLERQYQQWQIALPNNGGGQPSGPIWISAPQYSYYPPPPNYPQYPPPAYPPAPPAQQQPPYGQGNNPDATQTRETAGTTPANGTTVSAQPNYPDYSSQPTSQPSTSTFYPSGETSSEYFGTSSTYSPITAIGSESSSTYPPYGSSSSQKPTVSSSQPSTTYESSSTYRPSTEQSSTYSPTSESSSLPTSQSSTNGSQQNTTGPGYPSTTSNSTTIETSTKPGNTSANATSSNPLLKYCKNPRGQFESKECNKYVNCWDEIAVEQQCPSGLNFNAEKQYCDYPESVDCGNRTTTAGNNTSSNSTTNQKCPSPYGTYRNTSDCAAFYVCVASLPVDFKCAPGTNYNDELKVCDYPYRVDCKGAPSIQIPEESENNAVTETAPNNSSSSSSFSNSTSSSSSSSSSSNSSSSSSSSSNSSSSSSESSSSSNSSSSSSSESGSSSFSPSTDSPIQSSSSRPSSSSSSTEYSSTLYPSSTGSSSSSSPDFTIATAPPAPVTETEGSTYPPPPAVDPIGYYNNYNLKKLPESVVNTGVRCYHTNVFRLTPDCTSVTVCQEGLTYIVNCGSNTSFDAYTQTCVPSFRARC